MKRVLMVAFHFPPLAGSSGIQRTLRFVQHLPQLGWQPLVLSAAPQAYERTSDDLLADVPAGTVVRRAFALNSARHLAFRGRYLAATARPDRWISWKFDAVRRGMRMIREFQPQAIWTTYPIATAHVIGAELQRRSGLPWIADFRDPMAQDGYPADPATWRQFSAIERAALEHAHLATFTTPGAVRTYRERYPAAAERCVLLENGYDEESFAAAAAESATAEPLNPGMLTLLHSGVVYPHERDPNALFAALASLNETHRHVPFRIRFRAAGNETQFSRLAERYAVAERIEFLPPLPYKAALAEMLRADGLLVLQAANCNDQIPAKVYEYFRARRPIVALTDPRGDTAGLLRQCGIESIAALDDPAAIASLLAKALTELATGHGALPDEAAVRAASRHSRSEALARLLDSVTTPG
jgi:glycosyltransferase involved in cell wall biosynthesis